jgi:kynurenine formamidase
MPLLDGRPSFAELPKGNARGVFGANDWFGTLNLLTPERTVQAAGLVATGEVVSLNASVTDWNQPSMLGDPNRGNTRHRHFRGDFHADDILDDFNPQTSSQWDHFLHLRDVDHGGFYNDHEFGGPGIELWADRGIVGRGVLLDVPAWSESVGRPWDWQAPIAITVDDMESCADWHGVSITAGTILLVRTGWETGYRSLSDDERAKPAKALQSPGLASDVSVAEWLWDNGIAAVAADNPTLEAWPMPDSPAEWLHKHLLARLGIPIGELWLLDALAARCRDIGRHEFLLTSAPMNLPTGVSSPPNALAIL